MVPSRKLALTVLFALLAVAAAGAGFLRLFAAVEGFKVKRTAFLKEALLLEEKRRAIRVSSQILDENRVILNRLTAFLVNKERPLAFIEALEELAVSADTAISLDLVEPQETADALTFRLTVEGTAPRMLRYIALLENMPYIVIFEEFSYQLLSEELLRASGREGEAPSRLILLLKVKTI